MKKFSHFLKQFTILIWKYNKNDNLQGSPKKEVNTIA